MIAGRLAAAALLALALAGCGKRQHLVPPGGVSPVQPATAPRAPTSDELLWPGTQARPNRVDEPPASRPRGEDRFDLPPG